MRTVNSGSFPQVIWTPERDAVILGRAPGMSWDAVAEECDVSRTSVLARAKKLGCWQGRTRSIRGLRDFVRVKQPEPDLLREKLRNTRLNALPAGHPDTWGFLLALTPSLPPDTPYPQAELMRIR